MKLSPDPTYPSRRTYVVKLRNDATEDALCGRLENLVTGAQSDFSSARELFDLLARDVDALRSTADSQRTTLTLE